DRIVLSGDGVRFRVQDFGPDNGIEQIDATGAANVKITADDSANMLDFSATELLGIARIEAGGGDDVVVGSVGDDVIVGAGGNDSLDGGQGDDTYEFSGGGSHNYDTVNDSGVGGFDRFIATANNTKIGLQSFGPSSGIEEIDANGFTGVKIIGDDQD